LTGCEASWTGLAVVARRFPGLLRVESPTPPPGKSVYVAMHRDLRQVPPVRRFADAMVVALRELLAGS